MPEFHLGIFTYHQEKNVCTPCLRKLIFCFAFCHIFLQPATDNPESIKEHWTDQIYLLIWFLPIALPHVKKIFIEPRKTWGPIYGSGSPQSDVTLYSCKWHHLVTKFANLLWPNLQSQWKLEKETQQSGSIVPLLATFIKRFHFSMVDFVVDVTNIADRRRGTYNLVRLNWADQMLNRDLTVLIKC